MNKIKTQSNDLIIIEIPEDFYNYEIEARGWSLIHGAVYLLYAKTPNGKKDWNRVFILDHKPYNEDKYKILGKLSELEDKDFEKFVEFIPHRESDYNLYRNYLKLAKNYILGSAKQSFTSLLQSNGIETENKDYLIVEVL